jgi:hypothetical protein
MRKLAVRKLLSALIVALVAGIGVTVAAAPASAATSVYFQNPGGDVWGTVTFYNGHSVNVRGNIYGWSAGPGYQTQGIYWVGNGRYGCTSTPLHRNYTDGITRSYSENMYCSYANIQAVFIMYYLYSGVFTTKYIYNPYA